MWNTPLELAKTDSGSRLFFQLIFTHSWAQKHIAYFTPGFTSDSLLSVSRAQHLNSLLTMLKKHDILNTQQCKNYHDFVRT
jgi:hypothetical protein